MFIVQVKQSGRWISYSQHPDFNDAERGMKATAALVATWVRVLDPRGSESARWPGYYGR